MRHARTLRVAWAWVDHAGCPHGKGLHRRLGGVWLCRALAANQAACPAPARTLAAGVLQRSQDHRAVRPQPMPVQGASLRMVPHRRRLHALRGPFSLVSALVAYACAAVGQRRVFVAHAQPVGRSRRLLCAASPRASPARLLSPGQQPEARQLLAAKHVSPRQHAASFPASMCRHVNAIANTCSQSHPRLLRPHWQ